MRERRKGKREKEEEIGKEKFFTWHIDKNFSLYLFLKLFLNIFNITDKCSYRYVYTCEYYTRLQEKERERDLNVRLISVQVLMI